MIRILVSLVVAICKASTPYPLLHMRPNPPRLVRQYAYIADECRELCDEFSANRRGNGFDLCDEGLGSMCIRTDSVETSYCDFLYWSVTEDGQPGIVYSLTQSDLSDDEREHPVSCTEAEQIGSAPHMVHNNTATSPPLLSATTTTDEYIDHNS